MLAVYQFRLFSDRVSELEASAAASVTLLITSASLTSVIRDHLMAESPSECLTDVLSWLDVEFDVRQFVGAFSPRLPLIIQTTSGFTAATTNSLNEVGAAEVPTLQLSFTTVSISHF